MKAADAESDSNSNSYSMTSDGGRHRHLNGKQEGGDGGNFLLVSKQFLLGTLLTVCLIAFGIGRVARLHFIVKPQQAFLNRYDEDGQIALQYLDGHSRKGQPSGTGMALPDPVMKGGKDVPQTTYTSRNFNTGLSASTHSRWVVTETGQGRCFDQPGRTCAVPDSSNRIASETAFKKVEVDEDGEDVSHLPAGQHLLIDIENVDSNFLNSEKQLAEAMLELVNECGLTMLSYHCHKLQPQGVSCAGVLLESHVSFHTWPKEGVITLDLFTCGPNSLLPIVPLAERLFAIRSEQSKEQYDGRDKGDNLPKMVWAHKSRGFSDDLEASESTDMLRFPVGQMSDFKEQVVSASTDFQRMDVYDVLRPGRQSRDLYAKSLAIHEKSYESSHPEFFAPDRLLFLDGVLQSRQSGDAPYHESLVHPALFTHKRPRRVAIIGGGEGATLREVLKHNTVEKVIMIDIDGQMVNLSKQYLPAWNDCSKLLNGTASCFDDPRVETYFLDAFKWFIDRFSGDDNSSLKEPPFDVIIMDALDPQVQKEFVDALYDGSPFVRSLPQALSHNGILVAQVGEASKLRSPPPEFSIDRNRLKFIRTLEVLGFASIQDYVERHGGFEDPWQFIVAFRDFDSRAEWYANSALIDVKIQQRGIRTTSGASPFLYFDGATMKSYQYPDKASEIVFCRTNTDRKDCSTGHGFDPDRFNIPLTSLELRPRSLGEKAGWGVFATVDIPRNIYVGLEQLTHPVYMSAHTMALATGWGRIAMLYEYSRANHLDIYTFRCGECSSAHGAAEAFIDSTIHCFINHGCHGNQNVGRTLTITESSADPDVFPDELKAQYLDQDTVYNPARERQVHFYSMASPLRDIKRGEELLNNHLGMTGIRQDKWAEKVGSLRIQCGGAEKVTNLIS